MKKNKEGDTITEKHLFSLGYKKAGDNTYEKVDKETGMTVELEFNPQATEEDGIRIENDIIDILTR